MSRPIVRRTYGNASRSSQYNNNSSSSSFSSDPNPFIFRSSSPYSSDLVTPPSSPPISAKTATTLRVVTEEEEKENADPENEKVSIDASLLPPAKKVKREHVQSSLKGFFAPAPPSRSHPQVTSEGSSSLRPSTPVFRNDALDSSSKASSSSSSPALPLKSKPKSKPNGSTQLRLTHVPLLHSCKECQMSYVRGGEDEAVHAKHHVRVMRGIPWDGLGSGRKVGSGSGSVSTGLKKTSSGSSGCGASGSTRDKGWRDVSEHRFGQKREGRVRIVECDASHGGARLDEILSLIDISLSSPALPREILDRCKVYLAITSSPPPAPPGQLKARPNPLSKGKGKGKDEGKERVVGAVVSQGIKWAMRVLDEGEMAIRESDNLDGSGAGNVSGARSLDEGSKVLGRGEEGRSTLDEVEPKVVDSGDGVMCDPTRLPTPLGIHRLYTIPLYRSSGIARALLNAACAHTIYACPADPTRGQVAFSQPTQSGARMMRLWGQGGVRVFVDDESQL